MQYTMTALMQRDAPSWIDPMASSEDDIISIHDGIISIHDNPQSDVEMESDHEQPEQHTKDSFSKLQVRGQQQPL